MGTVLSRLSTPSFYGSESQSLDKTFTTCLLGAIEDSISASNSKSALKRKNTDGILRKRSAISNTSNSGNFDNSESSAAEEDALPSFYEHVGKQSTNGMTANSKSFYDINKNPTQQATAGSTKNISALSKDEFGREQNITKKPFKPDSWPTLEMIDTHLSKHHTYFARPPTTLIFARFLSSRESKKYVEIRYSTTENPEETILESSDKLETLITPKEEFKKGDTLEEDAKYFLIIFKTCINHLQGQVWWNGFSFHLDSNVKARLKVSALETQPISQLLFELTGMKELQVRRTLHRMELMGQIEGSANTASMYIRFRGITVKNIKVKQLRSNLITVHIPEFAPELIGC